MDKEARIDGFTDSEMRALIDALPEEHKKLFKAMVKGANAYIAKAIEEPKVYMPLEFEKYGISLKPITEEDVARITQLTVRTFGGTGGNELNNLAFLAEMQKRHGSAKAQKIFDDIVVLDDPDADTVVRRNASTAVAMARKAVVIPRKIPASTIEVAQKLRETRVARAELMERIGFSTVRPSGAKAACAARATRRVVCMTAAASSGVMSSSVAACRRVATSTWPGLTWPRSMKASVSASSCTRWDGIWPATSLQKMQVPAGEVSTNSGMARAGAVVGSDNPD